VPRSKSAWVRARISSAKALSLTARARTTAPTIPTNIRSASAQYAAINKASVQSIRPKMMTVCAILFGLLPIMQSPVYQADADVMKRIATLMIGGVVTSAILELLICPVSYVIWRKRELGFINNVKLQRRQLPIVRRLLLRHLLGAGSVFLFLVCRVRLCLFLRCLLARGFRRFVAHKHNAKVPANRRQLSGRERSGWAPAPISVQSASD
jgi:AcrB/AcrD/AcrF family